MRRLRIVVSVLALAAAVGLLAISCGGGSGGGPQGTTNDAWDQMDWDTGLWQ